MSVDQLAVGDPIRITYDDDAHKYTLDGKPVPSVTEIIDRTSPKDALPWWGMRVGMAAVVHAMSQSGPDGTYGWADLAVANTPTEIIAGVPAEGREHFTVADKRRKKPKTLVEKIALERKITTNHIKDEAADRGTSIHAALEAVGNGMMPDISQFPELHQGYVQAIMQWWLDQEPEFLEQEVIVGSRLHRYAGRFDMVCRFHRGAYTGQVCLVDLKTSKAVYHSHLEQLVGYEIAYAEMALTPAGATPQEIARFEERTARGEPVFDRKLVLHAAASGAYNVVESRASRTLFEAAAKLFHERQACIDAHPELKR